MEVLELPSIMEGVDSLLDNYIKVQDNDHVVILYTPDSSESAIWTSVSLENRGIGLTRVLMSPIVDEGFENRLISAISSIKAKGKLILLSYEKDTMSHTSSFIKIVKEYGKSKVKVFRAISACKELFSIALKVSPQKLSAFNTTLLRSLMPAKKIRVKTEGGTDLLIELDSGKHRWISNRGISKNNGFVILPAGEVATYPSSIEGVFVADFAFNVNAITDIDSRLVNSPVKVWIENSRATKFECENEGIRKFLEECFQTHCAFNIGEVGFGTNSSVDTPIYMNSHINERKPGIHLGFGQHNQDPNVVGYQCAIHLDLIANGGLIWVDESSAPIDLKNISPSIEDHPKSTLAQDVFSPETEDTDELEIDDCCGILTSEGFKLFTDPECRI